MELRKAETCNSQKALGEAAFLTLTTSPGNHQAWVAVSDIKNDEDAKDFSRRLRKGMGADKTASGATRVAGTVNYKRNYEPDFPMVRIDEAHPGRVVTKAQLEALGIVTHPNRKQPLARSFYKPGRPARANTSIGQIRPGRITRSHLPVRRPIAPEPSPDRSMADLTWCMTAVDWGWSIEETAKKLPKITERARQRVQQLRDEVSTHYRPDAAAEVARNDQKRGRGEW